MNNKIILTVLLAAVLLFATGCGEEGITVPDSGYIGGTEGIVIEYGQDTPPAEVIDDGQEAFIVGLVIENVGEHYVAEGEVMTTLTGIDLDAYSIFEDTLVNLAPLEGIRRASDGSVLEGGIASEMVYEASYINDIPVDQTAMLVSNVCYKYQTKATTALCLRKEVTSRGEETDPCVIGDAITAGNSGGPIQVSSMTEGRGGKNSVTMSMTIENFGNGDVFLPEAINEAKCSTHGTNLNDYKNKVQVTVDFPGKTVPISCGGLGGSNTGTVTMVAGSRAIITCKIDTSSMQETTFTMNPNVELDYMYKEAVSTDITILNIA
jgi:hypothetical protein